MPAAQLMPFPGRTIRLVMRRACGDFGRWRSHGAGPDVTLCLKLSRMQLVADGFVDSVSAIVDEFDLDPNLIRLAISEHVMQRDASDVQHTLAALKDVGVRLAIDDYGCGNVALAQLKSCPVDALKMNTEFTRGLADGGADPTIVRAIVGLASSAGVELTAQDVESSAAAATLLRLGCHRAQGSLLSRPVCSDVMESLLVRRRIPLPQLVTRQLCADRLTAMPTPHTV
jgi:diguanylate cyclase